MRYAPPVFVCLGFVLTASGAGLSSVVSSEPAAIFWSISSGAPVSGLLSSPVSSDCSSFRFYLGVILNNLCSFRMLILACSTDLWSQNMKFNALIMSVPSASDKFEAQIRASSSVNSSVLISTVSESGWWWFILPPCIWERKASAKINKNQWVDRSLSIEWFLHVDRYRLKNSGNSESPCF